MDTVKFRIYYGDGSTFEGEPEDAPTRNVQAIAWNDDDEQTYNMGRVVLEQWDIYIYSDDIGWHGTNKWLDVMLHLEKGCGPRGVRAVLFGQWINRQDFRHIIEKAKTDPIFNPKSARADFESGEQ